MKAGVLVVGAGPVGLTMAAELARYGVPVRIVDKSAQRTDKSKALVLWSRTLELIDRMGCGESFVNAGLKVKGANFIAGDKTIAHIPLDHTDTPHPYALMLPQSETERLMEEHLNTCGIHVERQVELLNFAFTDDHVAATMRHADGQEETLDAAWLIGCDGAHSAVRHGLGMQFEGTTQPSDWILADVHLNNLPGKPDEVNLYWHADGALAIFPITPGRYRIIADVGDAKTDHPRPDPTLAEVQTILDTRGPGGASLSNPIWLASFRINERKVADYRAGRIFLAGDAAHVHSPAGGQGMNTGMQDACNLAWKLALVYRELAAPEPLLQSYSTERSAVGRQVLSDAGRMTTVFVMKSGIAQQIRNHVAGLLFGLSSVQQFMASKLTELVIGYPKSPLTLPGHHPRHTPAAGQRAPIPPTGSPVGSGHMPRFALFAASTPEAAALIARYPGLLEPQVREPIVENVTWLVRPDGYISTVATPGDWTSIEKFLQIISPKH